MAANKPAIGPAMPPHLYKRDRDSGEDSDHVSNAASSAPPAAKKARTMGPAPPPPRISTQDDDSDDDEDDYGPALPGSAPALRDGLIAPQPQESGQNWDKNQLPSQTEQKSSRREEWMMMPPEADDLATKMDPTKIRARKFNSKTTTSGDGMNKSWTETPEEKRKRLEDQVLGVTNEKPTGQKSKKDSRPKASKDEQNSTRKQVGPSLYEMHKQDRQHRVDEEADDPTKRGFDWEKDMQVSGRVSNKQKRDLLGSAKNMGGRFSKGTSL
ncbi:MAG: hypothetical protein Q9162_000644 [Coniocarpon cinnabarinum]